MMNKIRIGLIDSGITLSSPLIDRRFISDGSKNKYPDFKDRINHGTRCAHLIQKSLFPTEIFNVKVFDRSLVTSSIKIINSIDWCIENNIKLINLSISVNDPNYYYEFKNICDKAVSKGSFIVASADNLGRVCLPAYLDNVIGVGIAQMEVENEFFYTEEESIQIYANGLLGDNEINPRPATSYATARMTGIIANILGENPDINYNKLLTILKSRAQDTDLKKIIVKNQLFDFYKNTLPILMESDASLRSNSLGKILLFADIYEINLFKNYSKLLNLRIHAFCFPEDINPFNFNNISLYNQHVQLRLPEGYDNLINEVDTIFIGKLPDSLIHEIIKKSQNLKKKVISLYQISEHLIKDDIHLSNIQTLSNKNKIKLDNELTKIPHTHILNNQIPILSLINLNEKHDTFSVELTLRQELLKLHYKIGQISSYPLAEIFGFDHSYSNYCLLPIQKQSTFAKILIESVNNKLPDSDLIVVGLDTPPVPENLINSDFFSTYSISGISLLFGFQPDGVILIINELMSSEYIINNIICLEALLNTKVILIIYKGLTDNLSSDLINNCIADIDQIKCVSAKRLNLIEVGLKKKVGIPVYDISNKRKVTSIIDELIRYFNIQKS